MRVTFRKKIVAVLTMATLLFTLSLGVFGIPLVSAADDGLCEASEIENFIIQNNSFDEEDIQAASSLEYITGTRTFYWMHNGDNSDCDNKEFIIGARVQGTNTSFLPYLFDGTGGVDGVYRSASYNFDTDLEGADFDDGVAYQFRLYVYGGDEEQAVTVLKTIDNITYDNTEPGTPSIDINNTSFTDANNTANLVFTFNEAVDFTEDNITAPYGSISNFTEVSLSYYTATFTADDDTDITGAEISVDSSWTDLAGNSGSSTYSNSYSIDTENPTVDIDIDDTQVTADESFDITFEFSEEVSGFTVDDITADNGVISNFSGSGSSYTATYTPNGSTNYVLENYISISSDYTDLAGNTGNTGDSESFSVDTTVPELNSIVIDDTDLNIDDEGSGTTVTFTFSEEVSGFDGFDVTAPYGSIGGFNTEDNIVYTATFYPYLNNEQSGLEIEVDTDWTDLGGNNPYSTSYSNQYSVDTIRPTLTITMPDPVLKGETPTVTFEFSESVNNFDGDDITVDNGAISNLSGSGSSYTATFTPTDEFEDSNNDVSVDLTGLVDLAGNTGLGLETESFDIDTVLPTLTIQIVDPVLYNSETSLVYFCFSETPYGFTSADVQVDNGSVSEIISLDPEEGCDYLYSTTLTPALGFDVDNNELTVSADDWTDVAGNHATTDSSDNFDMDTASPVASGVFVDVDGTLLLGDTAEVTFQFVEAPTGFTLDDVTVESDSCGSLSNLVSTNPLLQTATFTPAEDFEGSCTVSINDGGWTDQHGNPGIGAESNSFEVDTKAPELSSVVVSDTSIKAGETATVTFTFSESVQFFTSENYEEVGGGTLTDPEATNEDGDVYTATFTPNTNYEGLDKQIDVNISGIEDFAGNQASGVVYSNEYTIDTLRPSVESITISDTNLEVGQTALVTIVMSEEVTGFTTGDITVPNGTLSTLESEDDTTFTSTLTPSTNTSDSTNVLTINNTGYTDLAGNTGTTTTTSDNYVVATRVSSGGGGGGGGGSSGGGSSTTPKTTTPTSENTVETETPSNTTTFPFTDSETHWARTYIETLYNDEVVKGRSSDTFAPDEQLTRAEILKIALELFGFEQGGTEDYPDVSESDWFYSYVVAGTKLGVVQGYDDGTFRPNAPVTRAEALKILILASKKAYAGAPASPFTDVPQDAWFADFVDYAYSKQIVSGKTPTLFAPNDYITRAEMAKVAVLTSNTSM